MVWGEQGERDLRGPKVFILSIYDHLVVGGGPLNNRRSLSVSLTAAGVRVFRRFDCEDPRLGVRIYGAASWGLRRIRLGAHSLPVVREHQRFVVLSGVLLLQLVCNVRSHFPPEVSARDCNGALFIKVSFRR